MHSTRHHQSAQSFDNPCFQRFEKRSLKGSINFVWFCEKRIEQASVFGRNISRQVWVDTNYITNDLRQRKNKRNKKTGKRANLYELCYISIVTQKCYLVSGYLRYVMLVLNKLALLVIVSVSYSVVTKPSVGLWRTSNYATKFWH